MKKIFCKLFGHKVIGNYFLGSEYCEWDWFCDRCGYEHLVENLVSGQEGGVFMEEKLNAIIWRMNQDKFNRFQILGEEMKQIFGPSSNPDTFAEFTKAIDEADKILQNILFDIKEPKI